MFVEFKNTPTSHYALKTKRFFPVLGMEGRVIAIQADWYGAATPYEVKQRNSKTWVNPAYPEEAYDRKAFGWYWFSKDDFILHETITNAEAVVFLHS